MLDGSLANKRKAQEALFRHFYGFTMTIASRYSRDEMDAADIVSHAFVKFLKAFVLSIVTKDYYMPGSNELWSTKDSITLKAAHVLVTM